MNFINFVVNLDGAASIVLIIVRNVAGRYFVNVRIVVLIWIEYCYNTGCRKRW